tara:strand:- start:1333 stop:2061 length:729 start_codon:yes stop_codon:yes gene_type:complete
MRIADKDIGFANISESFEDGQTTFAVWFTQMMNRNGWSHPRLVTLATTCSNGKAWVHSSQIASLRVGRLKSPGPRSFGVLAYLFHEIDAYQKGTKDDQSPSFSGQEKYIENAEILRDDKDAPASIGYLFEVFLGWRTPPVRAIERNFSDEQAETISRAAGKKVRRLVAASNMDLIDDMSRLKRNFSNDPVAQENFNNVVIGQATWANDELDLNVTCLCHLLQKVFKQDIKPEELMNDLLESI